MMRSVYSSHLDAIGYDPDTQALHVRYKRGRTGVFVGVPPDVAADVVNAASIGSALRARVRGKYEFRYQE